MFNLVASDITTYPIPITPLYDNNFRFICRTNECMTKSVYDPLHDYASFKMRLGNSLKGGRHAHKSYGELLDLIDEFDENSEDIDNQFEDLIPLEMQLHYLVGI